MSLPLHDLPVSRADRIVDVVVVKLEVGLWIVGCRLWVSVELRAVDKFCCVESLSLLVAHRSRRSIYNFSAEVKRKRDPSITPHHLGNSNALSAVLFGSTTSRRGTVVQIGDQTEGPAQI